MVLNRIIFQTFNQGKSQVKCFLRNSYLFFFQIFRIFSTFQVPKGKTYDQKTYPISGARTVFNGINAETMFTAQNAFLPELAPGEILVKVINSIII
jgi:hypothetical protein